MKFCADVIKSKLDFTSRLYQLAKVGTRRKSELSEMCNDYREAYMFLSGEINAVSFVPEYSLRELRRQMHWLNYDAELHATTIEEVNYCLNKMKLDGTKGLSGKNSKPSS
jgi:hypothetical protein